MQRRLLLGNMSLSGSLRQESIEFLGASHPASDLDLNIDLNILCLVLLIENREVRRQVFCLCVSRAEAIFNSRVSPSRYVRTSYCLLLTIYSHDCL